jgi:hypothetical protein
VNSATCPLSTAAWLGAVVDRMRRGAALFPEDEAMARADRESFGPTQSSCDTGNWEHRPCPDELVPLVHELHQNLRGRNDEKDRWSFLFGELPFCPPESVIEDLIERDVDTCLVGHLALSDRLLWQLAEVVPESLLTLAKRRFLSDTCVPDRFEEVLHAFPQDEWMLSSLVCLADGADEKSRILARYLAAHPDRDKLVKHATEELRAEVQKHRG